MDYDWELEKKAMVQDYRTDCEYDSEGEPETDFKSEDADMVVFQPPRETVSRPELTRDDGPRRVSVAMPDDAVSRRNSCYDLGNEIESPFKDNVFNFVDSQ